MNTVNVTYLHEDAAKYDRYNVELANISRCYEIVKQLPLKRYTYSDVFYSKERFNDRTQLGWILSDLASVLPKSYFIKNNCVCENIIKLADPSGNLSDMVVSCSIIPNFKLPDYQQIYANMYGALQKVIQDKEALEEKVASQQKTIDSLLAWATSQGFQPPPSTK